MGEYADVKRKRVLKLLHWLERQPGFTVNNGGKHHWIVKHEDWERPFPIPFKDRVVNKHVIKELMARITETTPITKEQFDEKIK
ncbi:hypothetical protein KJ611_00970 [Patescibacteria group bacterium]|nr:hypothetical protein [Patescibacteria group bacterium]